MSEQTSEPDVKHDETKVGLRVTALDFALRCSQPGSHADAVMAEAEKFLAWMTAKDA